MSTRTQVHIVIAYYHDYEDWMEIILGVFTDEYKAHEVGSSVVEASERYRDLQLHNEQTEETVKESSYLRQKYDKAIAPGMFGYALDGYRVETYELDQEVDLSEE